MNGSAGAPLGSGVFFSGRPPAWQTGIVPAPVSVNYRMAIAALILLGWATARRIPGGIALGIAGVALVFGVDLPPGLEPGAAVAGLAWALAAALATAGGTVIGAGNQRAGIPIVTTLVWGAIVGAAGTALWSLAAGLEFRFDPSSRYVVSLAYLAILASVAAFLIHFHLVGRIGPGRAAYALAVVPVIALLLSSLFEGLVLTPGAGAGVALILTGNVLVLRG
jgi:drug/metabolite transporter (DMT)-like permease